MTLLAEPRPSDPIQGPDRPFPGQPYPQLAEPYPRPEPSNPTPFPPPRPNISLRIGRPPRLPRRQRIARVVNQCGRYSLALGLIFAGASWLPTTTPQVFWLGVFAAAYVANSRRPKKSRATESARFARRRGAGATPRRWRSPGRRVGLLTRRAVLPPG